MGLVYSMTMHQYDGWISDFRHIEIDVAGISTAVHVANPIAESRQTVLLVHGVGGNYFGLVPLAYEMKDKFNVVMVDLPSHGDSQDIGGDILGNLRRWSESLVEVLRDYDLDIDYVIAHSFGCFLASYMGIHKTWFINPPFTLKLSTKLYFNVVYRARFAISLVYSAGWFENIRRRAMLRVRTDLVGQRLDWMIEQGVVDRQRFMRQAVMTRQVLSDSKAFCDDHYVYGVISSNYDTVVGSIPNDYRYDYLLELDAGHLSVTESPELIAEFLAGKILDKTYEIRDYG